MDGLTDVLRQPDMLDRCDTLLAMRIILFFPRPLLKFSLFPSIDWCIPNGQGRRHIRIGHCPLRSDRDVPFRKFERTIPLCHLIEQGFDTGIATTTIAHQSFLDYMDHPSKAITGAVVAVYIAGEAGGAILQTLIGDQLGRLRFMQLMCIIATIGTVIQTASINMGMFLAGRVLAGFAVGGLVSTTPIYLSEVAPPQSRGLIGGISGCGKH